MKTNSKLIKATLCGVVVAFSMGVVPVMAADYDLVINNGRVMDPETQFDDIVNLGIVLPSSLSRKSMAVKQSMQMV